MTEQISVNLSSDVSYVYGIVNGIEADFSLTAPGVWSAVVPKAPDGRYEVAITAYNNLGTPTQYHIVIYRLEDILSPKTDWTREDYYDADDLNRVEANTQFIARYLREIQYNVPALTSIEDRTPESIDFISSINRVEGNIESIRTSFLTPPGYQERKIWALGMGFDYRDANRLENNLSLLYEWAIKAKENQVFCGTFACGAEWEGVIY